MEETEMKRITGISEIVKLINKELGLGSSHFYSSLKEDGEFFRLFEEKFKKKIDSDFGDDHKIKIYSRRIIDDWKRWKMTIIKDEDYSGYLNIIMVKLNTWIDIKTILDIKKWENDPILIFKSPYHGEYVAFDSNLIKDEEIERMLDVHERHSESVQKEYLNDLREVVYKEKVNIYSEDANNGLLVEKFEQKTIYRAPSIPHPQLSLEQLVNLYKYDKVKEVVDEKINIFLNKKRIIR